MRKILILFLIFSMLICRAVKADLNVTVPLPVNASGIKSAVNQVAAAGGGTVYIPAGTWNFVEVGQPWVTVNIPAGVNVFGAPTQRNVNGQVIEWRTILVMPYEATDESIFFEMKGNDSPTVTSRFSDIKLIGWRFFDNSSTRMYTGIHIVKLLNFRVDHSNFQDMEGSALWIDVGDMTGSNEYTSASCSGVVDHCVLNNTFGNPGFMAYDTPPAGPRTLGYGIGMRRWAYDFWDYNTSNIWGHYTNYTIFIEDNYFSKWRHGVCSNDGFHYVFRHNIVESDYGDGSIDGHGSYADDSHPNAVGTRALEIYENTFRNPDLASGTGYSHPRHWAINHRGGTALITNNTILGYQDLVDLNDDWGNYVPYCPHCKINQTYIWNNSLGGADIIGYNADSQENFNYFLRAPNMQQDGLSYTPYPYPHPLTLEPVIEPPVSNMRGTLKDKNNQPIQATIIVYQNGTSTMVGSTQTNSSGYYSLQVPNGTYDIQFNLTNFYIPGYSIKLNSINATNDTNNLIQSITGNQSGSTVSIILDINHSQNMQITSSKIPSRVKKNDTIITAVSSLSNLLNNTWFYQPPNLYLVVTPEITSRLHVEGRWIKDESGKTIILRGANQAGYVDDPNGWWNPVGGGIYSGLRVWNPNAVKAHLDNMSKNWGMNILRIHNSIEFWKYDNSSYRQHIKDTISWAGERGMYVIFDPYCVGGYWDVNGNYNCQVPELPFPPYTNYTNVIASEDDFVSYWTNVSNGLKDYSNVIFEFYNEPHGNDTVKQKYFDISQRLINAVRGTGANQPILIQWDYGVWVNLDYPPPGSPGSSMNWVENYPLTDPLNNLIYSTHIYRDGGFCHRSDSVPSSERNRWNYSEIRLCLNKTLVDYVSNTLNKPLLVGEIGALMWYTGDDLQRELAYFNNTLSILNEWNISYVDWVWDSPAHLGHGVLQNAVYIPSPNEAGQILINKIAEGK